MEENKEIEIVDNKIYVKIATCTGDVLHIYAANY